MMKEQLFTTTTYYRILLLLIIIVLVIPATTLASPNKQEIKYHIVQADDWLSKLAEKFYGDKTAYPAIVKATNQKAVLDNSYTYISNPYLIEIGQKLSIPTALEAAVLLSEQSADLSGDLIIYSGRSETLVGPLVEKFKQETGLNVKARYGSSAEMAATIMEEGQNSPADVYYGQDAGALGALAKAGRLLILPPDILNMVEPQFRSPVGLWVGTSGRARTVIYNTDSLTEADMPDDIFGFCDPKWKNRLGWAPTNSSFQAFITAMRVFEGEKTARQWLTCMQANEPFVYSKNIAIVKAVGTGEIEAGFVNHYYLFRFLAEEPDFPARNYHPRAGGVGAMINVAGVGIIDSTNNRTAAEAFSRFLLSESSQQYFNKKTNEYPLALDNNIILNPLLTPIEQLNIPDIELNRLDDLDSTLQLLLELGIL